MFNLACPGFSLPEIDLGFMSVSFGTMVELVVFGVPLALIGAVVAFLVVLARHDAIENRRSKPQWN
ncbi:MAG: hypothetical protein ACAI25_12015 [Planctomycetota bacterium]